MQTAKAPVTLLEAMRQRIPPVGSPHRLAFRLRRAAFHLQEAHKELLKAAEEPGALPPGQDLDVLSARLQCLGDALAEIKAKGTPPAPAAQKETPMPRKHSPAALANAELVFCQCLLAVHHVASVGTPAERETLADTLERLAPEAFDPRRWADRDFRFGVGEAFGEQLAILTRVCRRIRESQPAAA